MFSDRSGKVFSLKVSWVDLMDRENENFCGLDFERFGEDVGSLSYGFNRKTLVMLLVCMVRCMVQYRTNFAAVVVDAQEAQIVTNGLHESDVDLHDDSVININWLLKFICKGF